MRYDKSYTTLWKNVLNFNKYVFNELVLIKHLFTVNKYLLNIQKNDMINLIVLTLQWNKIF